MKTTKLNFVLILLLTTIIACKNTNTETTSSFKVWGNCEQCKTTIESSCNVNGVSQKDWNVDSKIMTITFDTTKIKLDVIQKLIAKSGYDNDGFIGDNTAYSNLVECCQYERKPTDSK